MGNVSANVYAKFRCAALCIKKALGIFRELIIIIIITTTTTTKSVQKVFIVNRAPET